MHPEQIPASALPESVHSAIQGATALDRRLLMLIARRLAPAQVHFELWDGSAVPPQQGDAVARVKFRTRGALLRCAWDSEVNFGDAYMFGEIDIDGDLLAALEEVYTALPARRRHWWSLPETNGLRTARQNVHHHYDLGNDFYRLWLDREMVYTCAYFATPGMSLEEAQVAKMDLVCRKLRLRPGDRVVEAGCGWGALALHMVRHYGVTVRAFNVSSEQIAYAQHRASTDGLADRVEFIEDDYRNITGQYDRFVSVGMLEHVGRGDYPMFGSVIERVLAPDGRGLLHFIGRNQPAPLNAWIRKRIFPGAYPPTLAEVFELVLAPFDLSVLDVENLRLHYARTLSHWYARFSDASAVVRSMFDESFVRAWRLYLAGSKAAFTAGSLQLFQVVFARGGSNAIPWTRNEA